MADDLHWETIEEVYGDIQAELLRGLLEAQGIPVMLNQEGAGRAYGMTVGTLGLIQVCVPSNLAESGRRVVEDYYAGKYEAEEGEAGPPEEEEE